MNKKKLVFTLVIIVLIAAAIYGIVQYRQQQEKPLTLYGNVDIRSVNLAFRVGGRLDALNVDEGDSIQPGQPLAGLDSAPYQNALRQAQANVASARAQLNLLQEGYRREEIEQVRAQLAQSEAAYRYANSFYQRQLGLWAKRTISADTLEDAKTTRNQALATLQGAKDKLKQYESGNRPQEIATAQATLAQAEAAQAQAELDLKDTELVSPSAGVILTRAVEAGSMLSAGGTVFTLSLTRPVWVRAYVSEKDLGQAVPGSRILVYTDGRPDTPYHGQIGFVSPSAEFTPKTVETEDLRTDLVYRLRIVVNDADEHLRQGMPVTLRFAQDASRHE
ncbi:MULTISPECIES: secretion protein HlyD [unclassified Brenneria]|uniref:secretion protein HlyD n=1 Tax=unclassified Brenneria TaxID=2634434 RepID=UPI0029C58172|nr:MULTISPECIES: secretion protein HlyD [unclassified Brenneria]MDX5627253.1 secretion protein HlyD [Brenneria sp. L3-3Z]MDX5694591.1 secretion protein HlyD [Brenneria sp. L4-2C]MEE3661801.1 secretion protein HlyD [Brenneria sp. g21c3]